MPQQQQQQQQFADYDLLAVFSDEEKASAAEGKLRREGFKEEEIYRLSAGAVKGGEFRDHGPRQDRSAFFLRTTRSGPPVALVLILAVVAGLIVGLLAFALGFAFPASEHGLITLIGAVVGLACGALLAFLRGSRVRGAIGQDLSRLSQPSAPTREARTVIALRLLDPENISRKSRARAILLNNGGRLDRSVGRRE
uniref:Uncharacterized protein n=1 Tax=Thermogemmatispora argillosa TaxID=2045280 RepID=A0A455SWR3_9CHLR|nr:hypothetical protein KTA_10360 [Thermogemmatispora argillosa]